jgi:hypothetical protein
MPTTMEKQFNVWSVQEQLSEFSTQRQLEMNLKALRDQYINELMIEKSMVLFFNPLWSKETISRS